MCLSHHGNTNQPRQARNHTHSNVQKKFNPPYIEASPVSTYFITANSIDKPSELSLIQDKSYDYVDHGHNQYRHWNSGYKPTTYHVKQRSIHQQRPALRVDESKPSCKSQCSQSNDEWREFGI